MPRNYLSDSRAYVQGANKVYLYGAVARPADNHVVSMGGARRPNARRRAPVSARRDTVPTSRTPRQSTTYVFYYSISITSNSVKLLTFSNVSTPKAKYRPCEKNVSATVEKFKSTSAKSPVARYFNTCLRRQLKELCVYTDQGDHHSFYLGV